MKHLAGQQAEADRLRVQLSDAGAALKKANVEAATKLNVALVEEKQRASDDRASLISQMTSLIHGYGDVQDRRLDAQIVSVQEEVAASHQVYQVQQDDYNRSMDAWRVKEEFLVEDILKSREAVKSKIKKDWTVSGLRSYLDAPTDSYRLQMSEIPPSRRPLVQSTRRPSRLSTPR